MYAIYGKIKTPSLPDDKMEVKFSIRSWFKHLKKKKRFLFESVLLIDGATSSKYILLPVSLLHNISKMLAIYCSHNMFVPSRTLLLSLFVECVQTTRDVVSELLFLMSRNLEEASRKMISNRNPPSWHTPAGPWGDLFIFSKLSIGKTNQRECLLLSFLFISTLAIDIW